MEAHILLLAAFVALLSHHDTQTHSRHIAGQQAMLDDCQRRAVGVTGSGFVGGKACLKPSEHVQMPSAQSSSGPAASSNVVIVAAPCNTTTNEP